MFIASSGRARDLAVKLRDAIETVVQDREVDPTQETIKVKQTLWWKAFNPGEATLGGLINECKASDFAAVLLTEDDVTLKKGIEQLQPRDNCIFEAGLFTGALGLDPERVFLLSTVKKAADSLPSDLAGIVYLEIKVPDPDDIQRSIDSAADKIIQAMLRKGPYRRGELPCIPEEELMSFERLEAEAGQLVSASRIFVQTGQPMEAQDPGFAERVQKNIKNEIRYRYFFFADPGALSVIGQLIWTLGAAGVEGNDVFAKKQKIEEKPDLVLANLRAIYQHLHIHFLLEEPKFELCVHNSEVAEKAVCYLRMPDRPPIRFIQWCRGPAAKRIADSFLAIRKGSSKESIFRSTTTFDLSEKTAFVDSLCAEISRRFPASIKPEVQKLCFGE
jgi:hypothetical protein